MYVAKQKPRNKSAQLGVKKQRTERFYAAYKYPFATMDGKIVVRRESNYYVKFGVLPQIVLTMV